VVGKAKAAPAPADTALMRKISSSAAACGACMGALLLAVAAPGCFGGGESEGRNGDRSSAEPAAQVKDGRITVRPVLLAQQPQPEKPFNCTADGKGEEVVLGPSLKTNLREVHVVRTDKGVCAVLTFPRQASYYDAPPTGTLLITFFRHGDTNPPQELLTSGEPKHSVSIKLYNDTQQSPGTYLLSTTIPENGSNVGSVSAGRLGVGPRVVSVLVTEPKMPTWVLDADTTWRAQIL
jgi:hypothetical protein